MVHNFTKATLAMLILAGSVGIANAAEVDLGTLAQAQADLTFTGPAVINFAVASKGIMQSGNTPANTVFATGTIDHIGGANALYAVRFEPSRGTQGTMPNERVVDGTVSGNKLNVMFTAPTFASGPVAGGWWPTHTAAPNFSFSVESDGAQTIKPDTYGVVLQAAVYNP